MKPPRPRAIPVALTIAGSDPSGGAGVQADLKTFAAHRVYGFSAITSVIAQNSARVGRIAPVDPALVAEQIAAVVRQHRPGAIKTGALANAAIVAAVARTIRRLRLPAPVVDPVLISSSGKRLVDRAGEAAIRSRLIPIARIVTPNIAEAEALTGIAIDDASAMRAAARALIAMGARAVVIKGGHLGANQPALDLFYDGRRFVELIGNANQGRRRRARHRLRLFGGDRGGAGARRIDRERGAGREGVRHAGAEAPRDDRPRPRDARPFRAPLAAATLMTGETPVLLRIAYSRGAGFCPV